MRECSGKVKNLAEVGEGHWQRKNAEDEMPTFLSARYNYIYISFAQKGARNDYEYDASRFAKRT